MPGLQTLDDMVFENRNKEYGSYKLRRKYLTRLVIGFLSSVVFVLLLVLGYFWYINKAGDANLYSGGIPGLNIKNTEINMINPEELQSYLQSKKEKPSDESDLNNKKTEQSTNFQVTEKAVNDTFKPLETEPLNEVSGSDLGLIDDSTVFGGLLPGDGMGSTGLVDRIPEFQGGSVVEYVERTLRYPAAALKQKIYGTIRISFRISKTGQVMDVKIVTGINPLLDAEAERTIKGMPPWKPALRHGKPVNFIIIMPITFVRPS